MPHLVQKRAAVRVAVDVLSPDVLLADVALAGVRFAAGNELHPVQLSTAWLKGDHRQAVPSVDSVLDRGTLGLTLRCVGRKVLAVDGVRDDPIRPPPSGSRACAAHAYFSTP